MAHTFSQLLYHLVFSTQYRTGLIGPGFQEELYAYLGGIVRNEGGSLPDLLRSVKANSSRWVHERADLPRGFAWQEGYGAFTVSQSSAPAVSRYILNQEHHHRRRSFEQEWISLLKKNGIAFDPAAPFG